MTPLTFAQLNRATEKACDLALPDGVEVPVVGLLTLAQVRRATQAIRLALLVGNLATAVALAGQALADRSRHDSPAPPWRSPEAEAFVEWMLGLAASTMPLGAAAPARGVVTILTLDSVRVIAVGTPHSSTVSRGDWCQQPAYVVSRFVGERQDGPGRLHATAGTPLATLLRQERNRLTALLPPAGTVAATRCDECHHDIPDAAQSLINDAHAAGCSLHPGVPVAC